MNAAAYRMVITKDERGHYVATVYAERGHIVGVVRARTQWAVKRRARKAARNHEKSRAFRKEVPFNV